MVINPRLYYDCLENSCDTLNQSKCKIKTKRFFLTRFSCLIFVFHSVFPRFRQFAYSILFWALIGSLWYFPSFWLAVVIVSIFWFYNAPTYICHLEENDSSTDRSINFSLHYACVIKGEKIFQRSVVYSFIVITIATVEKWQVKNSSRCRKRCLTEAMSRMVHIPVLRPSKDHCGWNCPVSCYVLHFPSWH